MKNKELGKVPRVIMETYVTNSYASGFNVHTVHLEDMVLDIINQVDFAIEDSRQELMGHHFSPASVAAIFDVVRENIENRMFREKVETPESVRISCSTDKELRQALDNPNYTEYYHSLITDEIQRRDNKEAGL